jgi:hypothetical protein
MTENIRNKGWLKLNIAYRRRRDIVFGNKNEPFFAAY